MSKIEYFSDEAYEVMTNAAKITRARMELKTLHLPEDETSPQYQAISKQRRRLHSIISKCLASQPVPRGYQDYAKAAK